MALNEEQEMLLMAYADGELDGASLTEAEALIAARTGADVIVRDLQLAQQALRGHLFSEDLNLDADLSMVRGRVLTKMPTPARAPVNEAKASLLGRLFGWTRHFDTGQVGMAGGLAMAALLFAVVFAQEHAPRNLDNQPDSRVISGPVVAKVVPDQPDVIIEDMELDGGTVMFEGAEAPGETMIIWHMQPDEGGAG